MKFFTGCVAAATLALAATAAQAQVPARGAMIAVSDFDAPYAPSEAAPPPRYGYGYEERGPAPVLLPSTEVYAVLRENGFSPLGIPRLRGGSHTSCEKLHGRDAPVRPPNGSRSFASCGVARGSKG